MSAASDRLDATPDGAGLDSTPHGAAGDAELGGAAGDAGLGGAAGGGEVGGAAGFAVHLDNFEGPFDLLLRLIGKHRVDITEIALSRVTDEFIAHAKALGPQWDLDQTTGFLVVAATLLDLKTVRLLPSAEIEDEEDLALLEARDLLFARLLQYRAFKQVAALLEQRMAAESARLPRSVGLEERFASVLPDVLIALGPSQFAALAAKALRPREEPVLGLAHLHASRVSVREQVALLVAKLRRHRTSTFRALTGDSPDTLTTVARFLALLELFREGAVAFDQLTPLGELTIRWTGTDDGEVAVGDEYEDEYDDDARPDAGDAKNDRAQAGEPQTGLGDAERVDVGEPSVLS